MRATTIDGREIDLKQEALDGLKTRLRGPMLVPGDAGYEESPNRLERHDRPEARRWSCAASAPPT